MNWLSNKYGSQLKQFGCACLLLLIATNSTVINARDYNPKIDGRGKRLTTAPFQAAVPVVDYTAHNRGNIQVAIANNGSFGTLGRSAEDPFTGEPIPSCVYPTGSDIVYLWVSAFWVGAVVGRDTVVSTANEDWYRTTEFWPDVKPFGDFRYKSIDKNSPFFAEDARSEQDIICEYTDTLTNPNMVVPDPVDVRPHKPLNIKVKQQSMAWSYSYADDFILFDYQIENIGEEVLSDVYMGFFVDGDVWHVTRNGPEGWNDDIVGFYRTHPAPEGCGFLDTIDIAYTADNDGDPAGSSWDNRSALGTVGVRVVRTPAEELELSYNWWIINYSDATQDFGPRHFGTPENPFRDMGTRLGTPAGDKNKYHLLRNKEFDYDLITTALSHNRDGFLPPPVDAEEIARGYDTRYLLSFGPFDLNPGDNLPISFAWVGGENLHVKPTDFSALFDPQNPEKFYNSLDFSSLAANSRWASWVYDNPGVDTDSNGYLGKLRVCNTDSVFDGENYIYTSADSFYYEGDGVPDFSAAGPPPAPRMRIIPSEGRLIVRWNGFHSQTTKDIFSQVVDFEGYRVYMSLDDRPNSFYLITSYDIEDYNRYTFKQTFGGVENWVLDEIPFTLDSLKLLTGDPDFDPNLYSPSRPYEQGGTQYYFQAQDFNSNSLTTEGGIHKVYPNATDPGRDASLWEEEDITYDYGEPFPKYYEYELIVENLLPTVSYYVAVTSFDFGSPMTGLRALETSPVNNMITEYAQISADSVEIQKLDAYVYPNPYRIDAEYSVHGFENRRGILSEERARLVHFANLPNVCSITIYSVDGDLVDEIEHNFPSGGPGAMHATWDLLTRNNQAIVSGLYYFVVESSRQTQIGKLVVIK